MAVVTHTGLSGRESVVEAARGINGRLIAIPFGLGPLPQPTLSPALAARVQAALRCP